jgi:uncharacterized protein YfaS (alpha-2-macroglobulin family)
LWRRGVEYTYFARATTPGEFLPPPATAYEYFRRWGRSDGGTVTDNGRDGGRVT